MDKNELFVSRNKSTPKTNVLDMPTKIDDKSAINLTNYENSTQHASIKKHGKI